MIVMFIKLVLWAHNFDLISNQPNCGYKLIGTQFSGIMFWRICKETPEVFNSALEPMIDLIPDSKHLCSSLYLA